MLAQASEQIWKQAASEKNVPLWHIQANLPEFHINHFNAINPQIFNTLQLYCSFCPVLTVIDRCLQSHSAKSDMRHMGVPPSCHVHLPMRPLWLRWRWQEQSGACQNNRKRRTHTLAHSHSHLEHTGTASLSHGTTLIHSHCQSPTECVGCHWLPRLPVSGGASPCTHPLTGDSHWVHYPVSTASQRPEQRQWNMFIYIFIKKALHVIIYILNTP